MTKKEKLERNRQDLIAAIGRSAVGGIPIVGPLLSEIINTIIPNQRIDRLISYLKILEDKLSKIPQEIIDSLKMDEEFLNLLEEGFIQASHAITDERRKYIASLLINGISNHSFKSEESKSLLRVLQELSDVEIIWLRSFQIIAKEEDEEFRKRHRNILSPVIVYAGADKEVLQKAALQDNYKNHLERLGLIKNHIRIDSKTKLPEFNRSGQPKISHSTITQFGVMLLEQIGVTEQY